MLKKKEVKAPEWLRQEPFLLLGAAGFSIQKFWLRLRSLVCTNLSPASEFTLCAAHGLQKFCASLQ